LNAAAPHSPTGKAARQKAAHSTVRRVLMSARYSLHVAVRRGRSFWLGSAGS
jgi:hypothetical protein